MSEFLPQQPQDAVNMQLWQQHLRYKHLQELQMQQQPILLGRPMTVNSAVFDHLPARLGKVANFVGWESMTPGNSQICIADNTNCAHFGDPAINNPISGVVSANDQVHVMRIPESVPAHTDQSFRAMPFACTNAFAGQSFHADPSNFFPSKQCLHERVLPQEAVSNSTYFQEKNLLDNTSLQSPLSVVTLGDLEHGSQIEHGSQVQEFHDKLDQSDWSSSLQEKTTAEPEHRSSVMSLDTTEEMLLYDTDYFGAFPSIQGGSWSALMQEAVQASNSDNGFQEELSGLSFQSREQVTANQSTTSNKRKWPGVLWDNNEQPNAASPSSRHSQSLAEAEASMNYPGFSSYEFSSPLVYEYKKGVSTAVSFFPEQKHPDEGGGEQQGFSSNIILAEHAFKRPENNSHSVGLQFNSLTTENIWIPQLHFASQNVANQFSNKQNRWNTNSSMVPSGDVASNVSDCDSMLSGLSGNHVNLIRRMEPLESRDSSCQMQYGDPLVGKYASMVNLNTQKKIEATNLGINFKEHTADFLPCSAVDENRGRDQKQLRMTLPSELSGHHTVHQALSCVLESSTVNTCASHLQLNQPFPQRFGLQLGPQIWQPEFFLDGFDSNEIDCWGGHTHRSKFNSVASYQSLPPPETSRAKNAASQSNTFYPHHQANCLLPVASDSVVHQQKYSAPLYKQNESSLGLLHAGDLASVIEVPIKQSLDSCDVALSGQLMLPEFPGLPGNFLPSCAVSAACTPPHASLSYSAEARSGMSQQVGSSKVFNNTWTNLSSQHYLSRNQPNKLTPGILQSATTLNNTRDASLCCLQEIDDKGSKRENPLSDIHTSSTDAQNLEERQKWNAPVKRSFCEKVHNISETETANQRQELLPKHLLYGNSRVSDGPLPGVHQSNTNHRRLGEGPTHNFQVVNALPSKASILSAISLNNAELHGNLYETPDPQALKGANFDPKRFGNRLKEADVGPDVSQIEKRGGQSIVYGNSCVARIPVDRYDDAISDALFPPNVERPSFAAVENYVRKESKSSQHFGQQASLDDNQNNFSSLTVNSELNLMGGSARCKISPRMAPSWFDRYGTDENAPLEGQKADSAIEQCKFQKACRSMNINTTVAQKIDSGQVNVDRSGPCVQNTTLPKLPAVELPHLPTSPRIKKRKAAASELLAWHKVCEGSHCLRSFRISEMDWLKVTNRLPEKVENGAEVAGNGKSAVQAYRRLALSTQLTQQLLPAVPVAFLEAAAPSVCGNMIYVVAKLALRDAFCLISPGSRACLHLHNENSSFKKLKNSGKTGECFLSKAAEDITDKLKFLESNFMRLDKTGSFSDVQLQCQELERISITNRLGKYHRSRSVGVKGSSNSDTTFAERHVTAQMAGNIPHGMLCLSL